MKTTNSILVAVDSTDTNDYTMERAIEQAQLDDATLVVAHVMPTSRYDSRHHAVARTPNLRQEGITYTTEQARAEAEATAARAARAAIGDLDVTYMAVGAVGKLGPSLREIAAEYDCGTIMLAEERSWWRRRLGWSDRKLARTLEGQVVRVPRDAPGIVDPDPTVIDA